MIKTLEDLDSLIKLLKSHDVRHVRLGDVELSLELTGYKDLPTPEPLPTDEEILMNPFVGLKE